MKPNKKLLEAAVARHRSVALDPADLARKFQQKAKMARKRGAGDAEQVLSHVFVSKLPESVADTSSTGGEPVRFGRIQSRVYDGDFC